MSKRNYANYKSLSEAQRAVRLLNIRTSDEYKLRYKEDTKLSSTPQRFYIDDWVSWPDFLGTVPMTFTEVQELVRALNIHSSEEYHTQRKEYLWLPSNPNRSYKAEWKGWPDFLGQPAAEYYQSLSELTAVLVKSRIQTKDQYFELAVKDSKVPVRPDRVYSNDWEGWRSLLGRYLSKPYLTMGDAQTAVSAMKIRTRAEYKKRYKENYKLPSRPDVLYKNEWVSFDYFLGKSSGLTKKNYYSTVHEARKAALELGATNLELYRQKYRSDSRLPPNPNKFYKSYQKIGRSFFEQERKKVFATFSEACSIVKELNIKTSIEYKKRYKVNGRLPGGGKN